MDVEWGVLTALVYLAVAVLGLCLGSFATALIYRIPRGIPWVYDSTKTTAGKAARSACTSCGKDLTFIDLVPLFSWLFLKGRCRHCRESVPALYPLIEFSTMLALLLLFYAWDIRVESVPVYAALPFLVAAAVIDWRHMILPDAINIILGILAALYVGLLWHEAGEDGLLVLDHVLASLLLTVMFVSVSFVLSKIKGRDSLGWGDVKFLFPAGLFLGLEALPSYMGLAGVLGLLTALVRDNEAEEGAFPFGPALIFALYIHLFLTGLGFDYKW